MTSERRPQLFAGLKITSLGTLTSRILGLVRDMATASLLGLAGDGVMDAFVVAFRLPNLVRRVFGEGALSASFLPVFAKSLLADRDHAWKLASTVFALLAAALIGVVLVLEAVAAGAIVVFADRPDTSLLAGLSAVMLPYLVFAFLAAQLSTVLYGLGQFAVPAFTPVVLNICWLAAAWWIAPWFAGDRRAQAYVLAAAIVVAGMLQVAVQLPVLLRHGFRFKVDLAASRESLRRILGALAPTFFGLSVTQLNVFVSSLLAWGLASSQGRGAPIEWLGGRLWYPMDQGAAATIYFAERVYQFPLGILGVAVATVVFARLAHHAARGQRWLAGRDLTAGIQLTTFLALPAAVGLVLVAEPLAALLFERGEFTAHDSARVARVITCYALGVWGSCTLPVIVRGYYALGDMATPVRIGAWCVAINLALDAALIWPLAESALAISTALSATIQSAALLLFVDKRLCRIAWRRLARGLRGAVAATAAMIVAALAGRYAVTAMLGWTVPLATVVALVSAGSAAFFLTSWLLGARELEMLISRKRAARRI